MNRRHAAAAPILALALILAAPTPSPAQERTVQSQAGSLRVETIAEGLVHPWGLALLPDGRMLVSERPGRLRVVAADGRLLPEPLGGLPEIFAQGQGGLLDVAVDPQFASNRLVWFTFAEPGEGGASTALAHGRLDDGRLDDGRLDDGRLDDGRLDDGRLADGRLADGRLADVRVVFSQQPKVSGGNHFGSRIVFAGDGTVYVTLGDRFKFQPAQDPTGHIGKVVRLNRDGSVPGDNPFVGRSDVRPEIWSLGHRNSQGAALHPETGRLWMHEHGPRGGDEINVPEAGRDYGWPAVSWGVHYSGAPIPDPPTRPEFSAAIYQWTPVIAPAGMAFYTADRIPGWRGSLLIGGLVSRGLVRLTLDGERVTSEERIGLDARVRDVRVGPDGAVYVLTDAQNGRLLRLVPAS